MWASEEAITSQLFQSHDAHLGLAVIADEVVGTTDRAYHLNKAHRTASLMNPADLPGKSVLFHSLSHGLALVSFEPVQAANAR